MSASPWAHFSIEELTCHCGCGQMKMNHDFMEAIAGMRDEVDWPFIVSSAYRCPEYNARISKSGTGLNGPHTHGRAMDVVLFGHRAHKFGDLAYQWGMTGFGYKQHGEHSQRFIHIDDMEHELRPNVWSY